MIKLYNLSRLPDEPLRSLLAEAMSLAGATGSVIVKVTRGGSRVTSYAKSAAFVYQWFLSTRRTTKDGEYKRRTISTDGGYVVMQPRIINRYWNERVPSQYSPSGFALMGKSAVDGLATAEAFFKTAVHEFAHVYDFQHDHGQFRWSGRECRNGRRPKWGKRPEEIRAVNRTDEALAKLAKQKIRKARIEELIIALGIAIEARR